MAHRDHRTASGGARRGRGCANEPGSQAPHPGPTPDRRLVLDSSVLFPSSDTFNDFTHVARRSCGGRCGDGFFAAGTAGARALGQLPASCQRQVWRCGGDARWGMRARWVLTCR
eukprot:366425-Chlamydomonas_euryale.AAC.4